MRALALAVLLAASSSSAQDLYALASGNRDGTFERRRARAIELEFLSMLPARLLDLFIDAPSRAERDALRMSALRETEAALSMDPSDPRLLAVLTSLRERLGDWPGALRAATRALDAAPMAPETPDLLFSRALARTHLGDHAGTRDDYLRALRFPLATRTRSTVLCNLAETHLSLGDASRSVEVYDECLQLAGDYALGWLGRAVAQDRAGEDPREAADRAVLEAMQGTDARVDALLDELLREGVFFAPSWERYAYAAMANEAIARVIERGEVQGVVASAAEERRRAARTAWQAWLDLAPPNDRWRAAALRHLPPAASPRAAAR